MANVVTRTWSDFYESLNFFRLHVLFFTFTPVIFAAIFYAANGLYPVSFIDALFNCISAMTVTGLATVDLSQLTGFQQGLLFVLMCIGNPVAVSWLIVYVRRRFFRNELSHIISEELKRERQGGIMAAMRERTISISRSFSRDNGPSGPQTSSNDTHEKTAARPSFLRRLANRVHPTVASGSSPTSTVSGVATPSTIGGKRKSGLAQRLRTDMIRRIETAPQRVDPMGGIGGLVVGEDGIIGGKGKARESNEQGGDEKHVQYSNGEGVHQTVSGSSGSQSRTHYDGNGSLVPESRSHRSDSDSGSRHDANGAADGGSEAGFGDDNEHHANGTITTLRHGPDTLSPRFYPSNLSPRTPVSPAPYMESPREFGHTGGILRHPEQDLDTEGTIDGDQDGSHLSPDVNDDQLPRSNSQDRSMADGDTLSSHRAGVSSSPVRFKPPPIRVTPGTLGDDRLSPGRGREFGHERQGSEAVTLRAVGTGEFPRTQTIEFANAPHVRGRTGTRRQSAGVNSERERERMRFRNFAMSPGSPGAAGPDSDAGDASSNGYGNVGASSHGHGHWPAGRHRANSTGRQRMGSVSTAYFPRTATGRSYGTTRVNPGPQMPSSLSGYGGFPMPHELAGRALKRFLPKTLTLPRTLTGGSGGEPREVPYISFNALVGRNSQFHDLSQEEQEELGGVEYRALGALLWIIAGYHIGTQLLAFVIIAPYSTMGKWAPVFSEQQHRFVPPVWFAAFQCVSAYTNTGMSLVDQSMVPFQTAYPMIVVLFFLILAGNTAFPICLRFTIWLLSKVVSRRTRDTLHFLLDHPRRCFIYLFPSHQTWFLFIVLLTMVLTDWISFMVLDIGNDVVEAIPLGTRFAIGLLQASAVRAAGFATLSIAALAPAVKVLYVTMMYVAVYPIAISVRSTNVYEEQSLGIYLDNENKDEEEPNPSGGPMHAWGSYLAWHARRQLSFDMWWLAFALWLVCIIERAEIVNPESNGWFDIFAIIFELTSAYGTVGLSVGLPTANYSFSGALKPLSKLVICVVMLRGRHRGLPHAIDRAVVLPREYIGDTASHGPNNSGLDLPGNRQSVGGETAASFDGAHRAPGHGVDLKHRTNTLLSPVHEILTPVTSVTGTPRATFSGLGTN
ncbi:TrkH-domain-containing protein [Ceratobasidium sp. AG-I]|nr:TrkH-domain-containing protein [Ceratobasidium sp. AG-I]